jgi:hypothetical protein
MASNRRRAAPRLERDHTAATDALRLPSSPVALLMAELWREAPELDAEPVGATHVCFRWSIEGVGQMAVRIPASDDDGRAFIRTARTDKHVGVELEALLVSLVRVDGIEDGFAVSEVLELTLGEHPAHPERHTGHVRAGRELFTYDWHIAVASDDAVTVLVDWRPLARIEEGRHRHHCTISLYPPFLAALTSQQVSVPPTTLSLRDRDHKNPEGNLPSLADKARMRIALARAPHEAARRHAARKGWLAAAGDRLELTARELLKLAGVNLDRVAKRGRSATWFDTLARFMPSRARKAAPVTPLLDTRLGIDAPAAPVPARPGPARASPTPAFG